MEAEQNTSQTPLWRNRDYLLLWSGQLISTTGNQVSQLAFPLLVLALTHSPTQAGIIATLRALPYLLLSLPAGAFLDRWNRKWVMILCDLGRACCMASVPLAFAFGSLTIYQLDAVALVEGTLFVFFNSSTKTLVFITSRRYVIETRVNTTEISRKRSWIS